MKNVKDNIQAIYLHMKDHQSIKEHFLSICKWLVFEKQINFIFTQINEFVSQLINADLVNQ